MAASRANCQHEIDLRAVADMLDAGGYKLVAKVPYASSSVSGDFMLWESEGSSS